MAFFLYIPATTNLVQATYSQIIIATDPELALLDSRFAPSNPSAYIKFPLKPSLCTINAIPKIICHGKLENKNLSLPFEDQTQYSSKQYGSIFYAN